MATFTAIEDLKTIIDDNFVFGNVTGLTAKPVIVTQGDDNTDIEADENGKIVLEDEDLLRRDKFGEYQNHIYLIKGYISYNSTDSTALKEFIKELDRIFDVNNLSDSRSYDYDLTFDWGTNFKAGIVNIEVISTKLWVT